MNGDLHKTIQDLSELVDALDRRHPQLQRAGEAAIVVTAMELRDQACKRIAELEMTLQERSGSEPRSAH